MPHKFSIYVAALLFTLASARAGLAAGISCTALSTLPAEKLLEATHPDFTSLRFVGGVACASLELGDSSSCDWEYRVSEDRFLESADGDARLLRITANHLTGSGAWDYVAVYRCVRGDAFLGFRDRFFYGATVDALTPSAFTLVTGEWASGDPKCCPSGEKRTVYRWSQTNRAYQLAGSSRVDREP